VEPELVIFDCDGVLVDSEPIARRITAQGLAALGWAVSDSEFLEQFVGRSEVAIRKMLDE